uniref:HECT-type E3 ubiquitin transferase n=1 Tax=Mucochytrium quahogii TaxID=96639 RepID=A0A7S2RL22_9STRA|mmetsp:Transcript_37047/g.60341  ORF Transcript_37047/g.60341 Transcript_37047/m.60341 type:complete len:752 (-) Transcript_37047:2302-4557(-)
MSEADEHARVFNDAFAYFCSAGDDPNVAAAKAIQVMQGADRASLLSQAGKEEGGTNCEQAGMDDGNALNLGENCEQPKEEGENCHDEDGDVGMKIVKEPPPAPSEYKRPDDAFSMGELEGLIDTARAQDNYLPIIRRIGQVFSDPINVLQAFCNPDESPDLEQADSVFKLASSLHEGVHNSLKNALMALASQLNYPFTNSPRQRVVPVLVALEYEPFQYDPELLKTVGLLLAQLAGSSEEGRDVVVEFWRLQGNEYLHRMFDTVQMYITLKVTLDRAVADFSHVKEGVVVLGMLHEVNQTQHFVEDYTDFYNHAVNELATEDDTFLKMDLATWFHEHDPYGELDDSDAANAGPRRSTQKTSFCDFPFILDPGSKARVLQLEARVQQRSQFHDVLRARGGMSAGYLILRVRRSELVDDVLDTIHEATASDFKKQLRVQFEGEDGVDEGGVRKEFFLLMVRQLLDPNFGMFVMDEDSRTLWFNPNTFEISLKFELVGVILGLAIYNGVILDLSFPLALYKKLLGYKLTREDLKTSNPQLGRGLEQLLNYDGDVESTFSQNFQVSFEIFGEVKTVDLKEGGGDIAVTNDNREEYVNLYVDYHFNKSIEHIYRPFHKGFHMVCGGTFLEMFHPEELELLLCGSSKLDFGALEENCQYEGFSADSSTIVDFWKVVHELPEDLKKKFLMFTTGSDRVPIRGLSALRLTIHKNGPDSDRLPSAHTCFNQLLLPDYSNVDKLRERLLVALSHAEGFGTM